jgi:hypothetical protein
MRGQRQPIVKGKIVLKVRKATNQDAIIHACVYLRDAYPLRPHAAVTNGCL